MQSFNLGHWETETNNPDLLNLLSSWIILKYSRDYIILREFFFQKNTKIFKAAIF